MTVDDVLLPAALETRGDADRDDWLPAGDTWLAGVSRRGAGRCDGAGALAADGADVACRAREGDAAVREGGAAAREGGAAAREGGAAAREGGAAARDDVSLGCGRGASAGAERGAALRGWA